MATITIKATTATRMIQSIEEEEESVCRVVVTLVVCAGCAGCVAVWLVVVVELLVVVREEFVLCAEPPAEVVDELFCASVVEMESGSSSVRLSIKRQRRAGFDKLRFNIGNILLRREFESSS